MRRLGFLLLFAAFVSSATAQESIIVLRSHYSALFGTQKNFNIFLPEGHDQDSLRYPTLYLFRGHEREWANPAEDGYRQGNIKTVADRLYASGAIGKMILVMPGLSQPGTAVDFAYVASELIPYIDANFRTIPVRQKRGMDGFSYGGYDMLELLRRTPELFFTAGAYDGSYWVVDLDPFFAAAPEGYWDLLRPMKFLIHSTLSGNYSSNLHFLSILASHGINNAFDSLNLAPGSLHNWYYADLHMERSLPLHWQHLLAGSDTVSVRLLSPLPAATVSGNVLVRWSLEGNSESLRTTVDCSRNRGTSWQQLYSSTGTDTSFVWNTASFQDGTGYMLRMRVVGDTSYGFAQMDGRFTVNNPGNAVPEVAVVFPDSLQRLSGVQIIRWWAEDADGDSLGIAIDASTDDGGTWNVLSLTSNSGEYAWNTASGPNASRYRVRIRGNDGVSSGEAISPPFTVANGRPSLQATLIEHIAGYADGSIAVHVVDSSLVSGHRYRVLFDADIPGSKMYSVSDVTRGASVLAPTPVGAPDQEGPAFDGLRLVLRDIGTPRVSQDSTRWTTGVSNLIPLVNLPSFDPGTGLVTGVPYASDYLLHLTDHTVDTSSSAFGWLPVPMNFTTWNLTDSRQVEVLFTDLDGDHTVGQYDDLILIERDTLGNPFPTWELFFAGSANPVFPSPGDMFRLKILKPFTGTDVYEFLALPTGIVSVRPQPSPAAFRLEQNYPNPFNPSTTIRYELPRASEVRLSVFDILGRAVSVLVYERREAGAHNVRFDGSGLASGVYFYKLEAGDFVQIRKLLLLR